MDYALKGRVGVTGQMPIEFGTRLEQLAESLNVSRHRLTVLALFAGIDIAAAQIRAEQAAKAAKQPRTTVKE